MAGVIKVNPQNATQAWEVIGKKITWFNVIGTGIADYVPVAQGAEDPAQLGWGPNGAMQAVLAVIQKTTTIIAMGPSIGGKFSIGVEGIFTDQDNFNGTTGDGDLKRMQDDIKALGDVNLEGVDVSGTTVVATTFVLA